MVDCSATFVSLRAEKLCQNTVFLNSANFYFRPLGLAVNLNFNTEKTSCLLHILFVLDPLTTNGNIILGGLFPIHKIGSNEKECGSFNELVGYQYMEAMLYAVDEINKRQDILPGVKLGTIIYDTCRSPTITADKTKEFIRLTLTPPNANGSEFAGVIGPFTSGNSVIVANFLRVFKIPQISYGSLTVELSNKDVYDYFFRTVPPDSFFAEALVKLLIRMGWTYVSIVYSTGKWAETGAQEVQRALRQKKICIAQQIKLERFPRPKDFDDVVQRLASDDELPSVVILVTIQRDSHGLLEAKKRSPRASRLSFVGSLEWSNRVDITKDLGKVADGTISFAHREGPIPEFEKHFQHLRFNNYSRNNNEWIGEYWQETFKCKLPNFPLPYNGTKKCSGDEKNTMYKELAPVQVVINAVQAMANALDGLLNYLCPGKNKLCDKARPLNRTLLLEFLRNVTFNDAAFHHSVTFNSKQEVDGNYTLYNFRWNNGSFDYVHVGSWVGKLNANNSITGTLFLNQSKVHWANGSTTRPPSSCRPNCSRNEIIVHRDDKCCWKCKACGKNDVKVNNTCKTCADGFVPNEYLSNCSKLPLKYVNMGTPLSICLSFLCCLGILADFIVFAVFFAKREHKLIKASGREMCYIIFLGICAIFMISLTSLTKPTQALCYLRRFIMGISFTICYAPLLIKMWRIHKIFKSTNQLRRLSPIGRRSLLTLTFGLIAIQGLSCALVFTTDPPKLVERFYRESEELVLECTLKKSAFVFYFMYNAVLLSGCTFYAFLTRHFPKNYNEAMYIGITMYLTCVVWVVFFATFLNVDYSISRVYWISASSLVIGWVTLVGLFAPKLYQLYKKKDFSRQMLLTWCQSSLQTSENTSVDESRECPRCKLRLSELKERSRVPQKISVVSTNDGRKVRCARYV